jgi:hypothetical protein
MLRPGGSSHHGPASRRHQEGCHMTVVERMKAAERADVAESRTDGANAGKAWARNVASPRHLRKLEANEHALDFTACLDGGTLAAHVLCEIVANDKDFEWRSRSDYPVLEENGVMEEAADDPDFIEAFVEAAIDEWNAVKDQV